MFILVCNNCGKTEETSYGAECECSGNFLSSPGEDIFDDYDTVVEENA